MDGHFGVELELLGLWRESMLKESDKLTHAIFFGERFVTIIGTLSSEIDESRPAP